MPYLYVLETETYSKLGKTINPKKRLREHAREIGGKVRYTHLWECSESHYNQIEYSAKKIASQYDGLTSERFFTSPDNLSLAIIKAASELEVDLSEIREGLNSVIGKRPTFNGKIKHIDTRVSPDWLEWLEGEMKKHEMGSNKSEVAIMSVERFFEEKPIDISQIPDDVVTRLDEFVSIQSTKTTHSRVIVNALTDYLDKF